MKHIFQSLRTTWTALIACPSIELLYRSVFSYIGDDVNLCLGCHSGFGRHVCVCRPRHDGRLDVHDGGRVGS